jgi:hypothetical protein
MARKHGIQTFTFAVNSPSAFPSTFMHLISSSSEREGRQQDMITASPPELLASTYHQKDMVCAGMVNLQQPRSVALLQKNYPSDITGVYIKAGLYTFKQKSSITSCTTHADFTGCAADYMHPASTPLPFQVSKTCNLLIGRVRRVHLNIIVSSL